MSNEDGSIGVAGEERRVLQAGAEKSSQSPVDAASGAQSCTAEVVESVSGHVRVEMALSGEATFECELVCLSTAASKRRPSLLGP